MSGTWVTTTPESYWFCSIFVDLFTEGGSTAAVLRLDTTAVEESRKKMTDRVARSPARLCSRYGKRCHYRRLEYDFLAFLPCFILFLFCPSLSRYVPLLRVPSSVQQSSAILQRVVRALLVSFVSFPISEFLLYYLLGIFRSSIFLVRVFFVLSQRGRQHLIYLRTFIHSMFAIFVFSLSHCL